ncbi:MAG TPA: DUF6504 family protein [Anaerolineales bacterium]|jgi:hypothetical protein|nr:DUF6504 family protein [Anaerolineales bacterium]
MSPRWSPVAFIDAEIEIIFDEPPMLSKKPDPPDGFMWNGVVFRTAELISSWFDHSRRGRMAANMQPAHLREAARRGSWGVGRYYFRLRMQGERVFDVYYDRAPEGAGDRAGHWYIFREMKDSERES